MNRYLNITYQLCGHVPFILIGLAGIYISIFTTSISIWFRLLGIVAGFLLILVMIPSMYIGLMRSDE